MGEKVESGLAIPPKIGEKVGSGAVPPTKIGEKVGSGLGSVQPAVLDNPDGKPAELPKILPASLSAETQADNPRPPTVNILSVRSDPSGSAGASAGTSGSDPAPPGKESWKWRLFHKQ
jgi:hypothetical protein